MALKRKYLFTALMLFGIFKGMAQDSTRTVVAQKGDGIYSILRNQGINITKYYAKFIELNKDKITNGSHLMVGETYQIPNAPDSFNNMGKNVQVPSGNEIPIFEDELASIKIVDGSLENAVYYLITDGKAKEKKEEPGNGMAKRMARKLLQRGARVYVFDNASSDSLNLIDLASLINKRYLKHNGRYQRLLVIKGDDKIIRGRTEVTVYHYAESEDGQKMANNILRVFGKNAIKQKPIEEYAQVFTDFKDVTFAKNILPTITFIEMGPQEGSQKESLKVASNKKSLAELITNGILSDYSKLDFEDEK